jgi:hypothetical protein
MVYRKILKEAKRMELEKQVAVAINKPKRMWNIINNEIGNTKPTMDNIEIKYGLNVITNPQSIADKFNSHFTDIIVQLKLRTKSSDLAQGSRNHNVNSFYLAPITEHEVENTMKKLKNSYSMGYDVFPEIAIKSCQYLIKPLAHIFNLSFLSGTFPEMLKILKIKPIPKGDEREILNYRPISILSVFSKILEKILCKRLNSFIEKNNILSNVQFGFRQGKSTEYACHSSRSHGG